MVSDKSLHRRKLASLFCRFHSVQKHAQFDQPFDAWSTLSSHLSRNSRYMLFLPGLLRCKHYFDSITRIVSVSGKSSEKTGGAGNTLPPIRQYRVRIYVAANVLKEWAWQYSYMHLIPTTHGDFTFSVQGHQRRDTMCETCHVSTGIGENALCPWGGSSCGWNGLNSGWAECQFFISLLTASGGHPPSGGLSCKLKAIRL